MIIARIYLVLLWLFALIIGVPQLYSQTWYLHHIVPTGGGTLRAVDVATIGGDTTIWEAGGGSLRLIQPTGVVDTVLSAGGTVRGVALAPSARMFNLNASGSNRLRSRLVTPPWTQSTHGTPALGGRHLKFKSDGGYIIIDVATPSGWKIYNSSHTLVLIDSSGHDFASPTGIEIDQANDRFWMSCTASDSIYEISLSTGEILSVMYEPGGPTGLFLFEGVLYCTTQAGDVKEVTGSTILSGLGSVQDLWAGGDLLVVTTAEETLIYRQWPLEFMSVELSHFDVKLNNKNTVEINVITQSEHENAWVILEHAIDGKQFTEIAREHGLGTSLTSSTYVFTVENLSNGLHYFRIRFMDQDDLFTFSPIRSVQINGSELFNVYPNPAKFNEMIFISNTTSGSSVKVYNMDGSIFGEMKNEEIVLPSGEYIFSIDGMNLNRKVLVR